jgi:tight adherence protein B
MRWFRQLLDGAGLAAVTIPKALLVALGIVSTIGFASASVTRIPAFGLSLALGSAGFLVDALAMRANSRRATLAAAWPEVIDALISAASVGMSIPESFLELAESGPVSLRPSFLRFNENYERGLGFLKSVAELKRDFSDAAADRLIELTSIVFEAGGEGYLDALRFQSVLSRADLALRGELTSKQGWVIGTAKLGVGAPWIIVAILAARPENASVYASPSGSGILIFGLVVSFFAYRLIGVLGRIPIMPRVFA